MFMAWLIIIALSCLALWLYFKFFKVLKVKNIFFVDGAPGAGKTYFCVSLAVRTYKRLLLAYKVKRAVLGCLKWSKRCKEVYDSLEEPCLYSNILLRGVPFVKITKELIYRKDFRFAFKSVLLLDELSLMVDQFSYKDRDLSERLSNFFKLFRHETHGGLAIIDSQTTSDAHYSIKYVLSDYLYIHHCSNLVPFFSVFKVQEMAYTADKDGQSITNVRNEDIEETCKTLVVWKGYRKFYDTYCYSIFTDDLPVYRKTRLYGKDDSLKDADLVSFKGYRFLMENMKKGDDNGDSSNVS